MPRIVDIPLKGDALTDLVGFLQEKFRMVQIARTNQIDDKAVRWEKNYAGLPMQTIRTTPFYRASNFVPQLIRMHSDILGARILGIIFGTKPFWMVRSLLRDDLPKEIFEYLAEAMNYIADTDMCWFETVDQIVNNSLQTGTLITKGIWNDDVRSYLSPGGEDGAFDEVELTGMEYEPIPFEDFWPYPITAPNTRKAEVLFMRVRLTKRDVEERAKSGRWNKDNAKLVFSESRVDSLAEARAEDSEIQLTNDVDYPYSAIECWLDWEIGGTRRPIVVVMNPQIKGEQAVLRAYYNFMPEGERPFVDFKPLPRKGSFYGYSVPEILEQSQEEQAQIHNARRDANMIANVPGWKKRRYADVPNPATEWYPGCVIELDEMTDLEPLLLQTNYNSMIDEEQFVMSLSERYVGISPAMQGQGAGQTGKRGVYTTGGTMAMLAEGNRRLDIFIRRLRYPFHRMGSLTMKSYAQFKPDYFDKFGQEKSRGIKQALDLAKQGGRCLIDLTASEASINRETERQNLFQASNVMAGYYEKIIQLSQLIATIPKDHPVAQVGLMVLGGANDLANQLLFSFDIGGRKRIIPDVGKILAGGAGPQGTSAPGGNSGAPAPLQSSQLQNVREVTSAVTG